MFYLCPGTILVVFEHFELSNLCLSMAYLGRGRREDLRVIVVRLGENVHDRLRIVDLRNSITKSTHYEKGF